MKILQLCKKIPYPLKDGESIAIHFLSKGLVENGCEVSLLALNTKKHHSSYELIPTELAHYKEITTVDIDTTVKVMPLVKNLFTSDSYNVERFVSDEFIELLQQALMTKAYDYIQLETLYMAVYIPTIRKYSQAKISMRSHNLENEIWKNLALQTRNPLKRWYFNLCAERLARFEKKVHKEYDVLLPISDTDLRKYEDLQYNTIKCQTAVGLDMNKYAFTSPRAINKSIRVGYIGSLDWKPNEEGLEWFFTKAWKGIKAKYPRIEFHLAGRNGDSKYGTFGDSNFIYHGEVEDALDFMGSLDILLVPLFSGSGIRVKILEAMALGKVVLSTEKGYEGIPIQDGVNGFLFHNESSLLSILGTCLEDFSALQKLAANARKTIETNFSYETIAREVVATYKQLDVLDI